MNALIAPLTALIVVIVLAIIVGIYCMLLLVQAVVHWLNRTGQLADALRNDLPGLNASTLWAALIHHVTNSRK